jgi:hypothetical protein
MPAPFYNAIKGTTGGAAGTGDFTPNAASSGYLAWSTVYTGWIGLVRFVDGSSWELRYSYWNGTTLSRGANAFVASSSGSGLSLSSAATAAMIVDASEVQTHLGGVHLSLVTAIPGVNTMNQLGAVDTPVGTSALSALATTNFLTEQPRVQRTSATTANAQAGTNLGANTHVVYSTASGRGGGEFVARWGASVLPTGPRLFVGLTATSFVGNTGEPSALTANYAVFAKDSTDTNIQLLVNSNAGSGTKTDTGIALVANAWYESSIWFDPGGGRIYGLLIRLDTGAIWYGSTTTDIPANGSLLIPQVIGSLSSTTGTAIVMHLGTVMARTAA